MIIHISMICICFIFLHQVQNGASALRDTRCCDLPMTEKSFATAQRLSLLKTRKLRRDKKHFSRLIECFSHANPVCKASSLSTISRHRLYSPLFFLSFWLQCCLRHLKQRSLCTVFTSPTCKIFTLSHSRVVTAEANTNMEEASSPQALLFSPLRVLHTNR